MRQLPILAVAVPASFVIGYALAIIQLRATAPDELEPLYQKWIGGEILQSKRIKLCNEEVCVDITLAEREVYCGFAIDHQGLDEY